MSAPYVFHLIITILLVAGTWTIYAWHSSPDFRALLRHRFMRRDAAPSCGLAPVKEASTFSPVTLMRWMLVAAFISLCCLFCPLTLKDTARNNAFTALVAGMLHSGMALSFGLGLPDIWDYFDRVAVSLLAGDRIWIATVVGLSPLLSISAAATLFRLPKFWLLLCFSGNRNICIFSDLNERSVKYAEALKCAEAENDPCIIFCTDREEDDVDALAGQNLVLHQNICNLHLPKWTLHRIHFYLIAEDENATIEQAALLQEKYLDQGCHIDCVSPGNLNEHIIDQLNRIAAQRTASGLHSANAPAASEPIRFTPDGRIAAVSAARANAMQTSFIDIINEAMRVVYQNLFESIPLLINREFLQQACSTEQQHPVILRVLVLGAGVLGEELARTLLWYCQLPGIGVEVTIADQEDESIIRSSVFRSNLLFAEQLEALGYGKLATLKALGGVNLLTADLEHLLTGQKDGYHFIFIATGDDHQNYRLALRLRRHYLRNPLPWGYPDIRAVIWDDTVSRIIEQEQFVALSGIHTPPENDVRHTDYALLLNGRETKELNNPHCAVSIMGSMQDTIGNLHGLEYQALCYHAHYCGIAAEAITKNGIPRDVYYQYYAGSESDRRSNWAVCIHGKIKTEWYRWRVGQSPSAAEDQEARALLAENEHIRWCIFKLLEGDSAVPEDKLESYLAKNIKGRDEDAIRGFHATLRTWEDLSAKARSGVPRDRSFWQKMVNSNVSLVDFALYLHGANNHKL